MDFQKDFPILKSSVNGQPLIYFDNAATSYTFYKGKNCLNYGNGCTISFHHTKPFGFGEGGAIIVDKKYEKNIRCLNNFGIGLTDNYYVKEGNNNKMSEVSAVYIIQYLENNFDLIIKKHQDLYKYFKEQKYLQIFYQLQDFQRRLFATNLPMDKLAKHLLGLY